MCCPSFRPRAFYFWRDLFHACITHEKIGWRRSFVLFPPRHLSLLNNAPLSRLLPLRPDVPCHHVQIFRFPEAKRKKAHRSDAKKPFESFSLFLTRTHFENGSYTLGKKTKKKWNTYLWTRSASSLLAHSANPHLVLKIVAIILNPSFDIGMNEIVAPLFSQGVFFLFIK